LVLTFDSFRWCPGSFPADAYPGTAAAQPGFMRATRSTAYLRFSGFDSSAVR
jgi:hypothetical protein